ncbi:MAG TPA: hypothetical protein EYN67_06835 [Flavobacteriales bacterium]|nr:hypothetical protein [Flavobacteriales bacterium]
MVIGKLTGYLALGLVGAFLLNALIRPASAIGTGGALQETGKGIASIGAGIGSSLRSIGSGSAKLLDPLFSLRDLVYDANVSGAASVGPVSQEQGTTDAPTGVANPSSSTITWSSGTTATVPTLSAAATSFYRNLGVNIS